MTLGDIRSLHAYNRWATGRFLAVIRTLSLEQLAARVESSFPSVLATLAHIAGAEWIWLRRWEGESPTAFPDWLAEPRLEEIEERLVEVEAGREEFLAGLEEADLQRPVAYRTLSGDPYSNHLSDLLLHVVNHSTYHRGQLTTLLRHLGASPPATDYVLFKREGG